MDRCRLTCRCRLTKKSTVTGTSGGSENKDGWEKCRICIGTATFQPHVQPLTLQLTTYYILHVHAHNAKTAPVNFVQGCYHNLKRIFLYPCCNIKLPTDLDRWARLCMRTPALVRRLPAFLEVLRMRCVDLVWVSRHRQGQRYSAPRALASAYSDRHCHHHDMIVWLCTRKRHIVSRIICTCKR